MYRIGVDLGGTTVKMAVVQNDGTIIDKWEIKTRTENKGVYILPDIAISILEKIKVLALKKENIVGIGIGVPAPVSSEGVIPAAVNLGWENKNIKKELEELTNLNVAAGNDANLAALGEMWLGSGSGHKNMIMVTLGTGVGGGIIINGHCIEGAHGAAGEFGHMIVDFQETENGCGCGRCGCLEMYASATGISRLAKRRLAKDNEPSVLRGIETVNAKDVFDAVKEKDSVAIEIAEQFGDYLGKALVNLSTIVDPSMIVIGGGVSKAGDILLEFVKKPYEKYSYYINKDVKFKIAQLENDAGVAGAAKLILGESII